MVEREEKINFSHVFEDIFANKMVVRLAFLNFCLNGIILVGQLFYENKKKKLDANPNNKKESASITLHFTNYIINQKIEDREFTTD